MSLSKETINELQIILKEEFLRDFSDAEASEIATNLVRYTEQLQEISNSNHED